MPLPSNIDRLPAEAREALDGWLRDPAITQTEATERVNELLETSGQSELRVSRDAVGRYRRRLREDDETLRQSREIGKVLTDKFNSAAAGQAGHLVLHMLRVLTFDLTSRLRDREFDDQPLPTVIKAAGKITRMTHRLERSSEIAARREREIKRQADKESPEEKRAERAARDKHWAETYRWIIEEVYGLKLDENFQFLPSPENQGSGKTITKAVDSG